VEQDVFGHAGLSIPRTQAPPPSAPHSLPRPLRKRLAARRWCRRTLAGTTLVPGRPCGMWAVKTPTLGLVWGH